MSLSILFNYIDVYILVMVRLAGMIAFNPLFSRRGVPAMVRAGLVVFLTLLVAPTLPAAAVSSMDGIVFTLAMVKELLLGIAYGYIFQVFYYMLYFVGDSMDMEFGISMAKTFDPGTSIQTSVSSTLLSFLFVMYFFGSGSHLALIHLYATSFQHIPLGVPGLGTSVYAFILELFVGVFNLSLRILAPFLVAEFILQAAMGILMRFVPQISIFVINFPMKILLAFILLYAFAPYMGNFIDGYVDVMFTGFKDLGNLVAVGGT